jgi:two-component system competent response regulator ComA
MTKNILLVDDNEAWNVLMKTMLGDFGLKDVVVSYAASGEEGIKKYEDMEKEGKHPDLVLMDIQLPNIKGNEAAMMILKKHKHANIFAFSMFPDESHRELMENAGVNGFISKLPRAKQLSSDIIGALRHDG